MPGFEVIEILWRLPVAVENGGADDFQVLDLRIETHGSFLNVVAPLERQQGIELAVKSPDRSPERKQAAFPATGGQLRRENMVQKVSALVGLVAHETAHDIQLERDLIPLGHRLVEGIHEQLVSQTAGEPCNHAGLAHGVSENGLWRLMVVWAALLPATLRQFYTGD